MNGLPTTFAPGCPSSRTVAPYSPSPTPASAKVGLWKQKRHPPRFIRDSNAIESSFATVKLRTRVTKGAGSKKAALAMAFKLLDAAQARWRRFNGHELVADVLAGAKYKDGIRVTDHDTHNEEQTDEKVAA
jgi:hypothetical protein